MDTVGHKKMMEGQKDTATGHNTITKRSIIKPMYNNQPRDPKIMVVVDRCSFGMKMRNGTTQRWSLTRVWLYCNLGKIPYLEARQFLLLVGFTFKILQHFYSIGSCAQKERQTNWGAFFHVYRENRYFKAKKNSLFFDLQFYFAILLLQFFLKCDDVSSFTTKRDGEEKLEICDFIIIINFN